VPVAVTVTTVPVPGLTLSLPSTLAGGGCAVVGLPRASGAATDVSGGVFTGEYNGAVLTPGPGGPPGDGTTTGVHVLVEDRACGLANATGLDPRPLGWQDRAGAPMPATCVFHPWGVDTNVTVVAPQGPSTRAGVSTQWYAGVFSRRGLLMGTVGPLAQTPAPSQGRGKPEGLETGGPGLPPLVVLPWVRLGWQGDGRDYAWVYVVYQAVSQ
jgi:hypothetical protein